MKKIIFLIAIVFVSLQVYSQSVKPITVDRYSTYYDGDIKDSVSVNDSTWNLPIEIDGGKIPYQLVYDFTFKITKGKTTNGSPYNSPVGAVNMKLQGKKFRNDAWTDIGVKVYNVTATTIDTTFIFSVTTSDKYNFYNFKQYRPASSTITFPDYVGAYFKAK